MALFPNPFDALGSLQQAMDTFRSSGWLTSMSGGGSYPPLNVFRKGDDFIVITELPGVDKSQLELQVKGNTIRLAGTKSVTHPEKASMHRRERLAGRFDRAVSLPVEVEPNGVKAEYHHGVLALYLPRAEHDKPRSINIG